MSRFHQRWVGWWRGWYDGFGGVVWVCRDQWCARCGAVRDGAVRRTYRPGIFVILVNIFEMLTNHPKVLYSRWWNSKACPKQHIYVWNILLKTFKPIFSITSLLILWLHLIFRGYGAVISGRCGAVRRNYRTVHITGRDEGSWEG